MNKFMRVFLASAIFLSGLALIPLVGLPSAGYRWQVFADAYQPLLLEGNFDSGAPGSYFTITGFNFPPESEVIIEVNDLVVGAVMTDNMGGFTMMLSTTNAEEGYYFLTTTESDSPTLRFWLDVELPLRLPSGEGTIIPLPGDIAITLMHLPFLHK